MAMVVNIVVEVGLVVNIGTIEQSCCFDWAYFREQIVQKKKPFFVIILIEDESRRKEIQIFDIGIIVSDRSYVNALYPMLQSFIFLL